ncbi:hypothetical protein KC909_05065, partial [Candidatus Dojkabacteria bacterium]|nr:hypothetical protein [Candidatus Dojkabacteria bacterium]
MAQELIEQDPVLDVNEAKAIIRDGFSLWYQLWSDSNQLTGLILHENDNINADSHVDYITEAFLRQKLAMGGELTANSVRAMLTPTVFAGCVSTGFAAYNGVSRNLASLPIVSDLDHIAPHNIPRQANSSSDVGEHKAHLAAGNIHDLLPHTPILVDHDGISNDTIDAQLGLMVNFSEQMSLILERHGISGIQPIIFDSVDVTGKSGWEAKFELHRSAYEHRIPVVGAYDIGTRSQGFYFPYHIPNEPLLHGKINSRDVANLNVQQLNMLLLPKLVGPIPDVPTDYARQYFA